MLRLIAALAALMLALPVQSSEAAVNQDPYEFEVIPYAGPESLEMEMVLRNTSSYPVNFEFPTSQKYEIQVKDANGNEVYTYSKGKAFLQALQTLTLNPDESMIWMEKWNYFHEGQRISEGEYQVIATLKARKINNKALPANSRAEASVYIPAQNPVFRHVKASGEKGKYIVTGETRPLSGEFYYTVEDGHNELITEKSLRIKNQSSAWEPFTITINISSDKLPENGSVVLYMYERSKKDENIIHSFPVILERI